MGISKYDVEHNTAFINLWNNDAVIKKFPALKIIINDEFKKNLDQALKIIISFVNENDIIVHHQGNLEPDELNEIQQLSFLYAKKPITEEGFKKNYLEKWKGRLKHAVVGDNNFHYQPTGIAEELREKKLPSKYYWLTDMDIRHSLAGYIVDGKEIKNQAGTYVLPPVSLTQPQLVNGQEEEPTQELRDQLETAKQTIEKNNIPGIFTLLIPVNSGRSHWRLGKIILEAKQEGNKCTTKINDAILWDSLGGALVKTIATTNFCNAVRNTFPPENIGNLKSIVSQKTGLQQDGYRCGDFVVREIFREIGKDNRITQAKIDNPQADELRIATIKTIAETQKIDLTPFQKNQHQQVQVNTAPTISKKPVINSTDANAAIKATKNTTIVQPKPAVSSVNSVNQVNQQVALSLPVAQNQNTLFQQKNSSAIVSQPAPVIPVTTPAPKNPVTAITTKDEVDTKTPKAQELAVQKLIEDLSEKSPDLATLISNNSISNAAAKNAQNALHDQLKVNQVQQIAFDYQFATKLQNNFSKNIDDEIKAFEEAVRSFNPSIKI